MAAAKAEKLQQAGRVAEKVAVLLDRVPGRFSVELGLDLSNRRSRDLFLWFLASLLYGARISGAIVARTHAEFIRRGLTNPTTIVNTGWDGLVAVLDAGGYVRYDFKTATKLLEVMRNLIEHYDGDLRNLYRSAKDSHDLELRLKALGKGIGDVTVQIFLRDLGDIWPKAEPALSPLALLASDHLELIPARSQASPDPQVQALRDCWQAYGLKQHTFCDFESALVRLGRDYCRRDRVQSCPMREYCGGRRLPLSN